MDAENDSRVSKGLLKKSSQLAQQRHVLGTLSGNNIRVEEQVTNNQHANLYKLDAGFSLPQHGFKKPAGPPPLQRQPLISLKPRDEPKSENAGIEDMEVNNMVEAFTEQMSIEDIDQDDHDNPQLCHEYVKDIYKYLRRLEQQYHVDPMYMNNQPEINERMRAILVDWLIQVHLKFSLLQETLYLTVSIIDRYLGVSTG